MQLSAENTAIVLDSTADLPEPERRHPNWRMVPLYVSFGDETFREYVDISAEEFYRRLRESSQPPKSSQPSPADFEAVFDSLSEYERILCVVLSSKISGTYESARLAAEPAGERVQVQGHRRDQRLSLDVSRDPFHDDLRARISLPKIL